MPGRQQETTTSSFLGTLLLRGFTMLAESCPDCNVPLMRDPSTLQSQCVGCHHTYTPAELQALSGGPRPTQPPAAEPAPPSGPLTAATAAHQAAGGGAAAAGAAQQHARPMNGPLTAALARHRRTTSTSGSSDGGTSPNLLPAAAPATPAGIAAAAGGGGGANAPSTAAGLSAQGSLGRLHSQEALDDDVLQAYQQIRAERQRDERQQLLHPRQQSNGAAAAAAAGGPPQQQQRPADISQLMADKMLAGWALLGDHCPMCSTPLMRERGTREVYCVACDLPVRLQQHQQQEAAAGTPGSTAAAAAAPEAGGAAAPQAAREAAQQGAAAAINGRGGASTAGAAAAAASTDQPAAGIRALLSDTDAPVQQRSRSFAAGAGAADQPGGLTPSDKQQVLDDLHHTLLSKLAEARQQLNATPVSEPEQLGQQLQLVQQLLSTLAAVQQ